MSALPCLALPCPDVFIKDYYLSLSPRLHVPVPPSCVHRDRRADLTVSGAHSPHFVLFLFLKVLFCSSVFCLSRGKEVAARYSAIAHCKMAWEFGGIAASAASPMAAMPSCPPIAGDIRRRRWLSQARFPGCRSLRRAVRGRSRHRIAADSMPAGPPLTQCPPDPH